MAERVCEQARRYMFSASPYGPKLCRLMIFSIVSPPRQLIGLDDKTTPASRLGKRTHNPSEVQGFTPGGSTPRSPRHGPRPSRRSGRRDPRDSIYI